MTHLVFSYDSGAKPPPIGGPRRLPSLPMPKAGPAQDQRLVFALKMNGGNSRLRDIGRHYPSGWRKRKTKEDKLKKANSLAASKSRKMTDFLRNKEMMEIPAAVGQNAKKLQKTKSC